MIFLVVVEFLGYYLMFETSINASRNLFNKFLDDLLHLSLSFFEQTPIGQILNRSSYDFDMIDNDMIFTLRSTINAILAFFICIFLIAKVLPETIPMMIVIFLPFIFLEVNKKEKKTYLSMIVFFIMLFILF